MTKDPLLDGTPGVGDGGGGGGGSNIPLKRSLSDPSAFPEYADQQKVGWRTLLDACRVVGSAFFRDESSRLRAWGMTVGVLLTMMGVAMVNLWFLSIFRSLQNALHDKDKDAFYVSLKQICMVCVGIMPVSALRDGLKGSLSLEWRRYMTRRLLCGYIGASQGYYRLKLTGSPIDNPDQRIGQDVGQFTNTLPTFTCTVLQALFFIVTQSGMLFSLDVELFMFVLGYSVLMNLLTFVVFGSRLTAVNRVTLAQEASFRFGLVRVRENAEAVAFYQGAGYERARCDDFFTRLISTLYHKLILLVSFESFNAMMSLLIAVLPYAIVAGKYLAGDMDFGAMSEAAAILGSLEGSFNVLVSNLESITSMGAQVVRIRQLWDALEAIAEPYAEDNSPDCGAFILDRNQSIELVELPATFVPATGSALLRLDGVTLQPPVGQVPLVHDLTLELKIGESLLVCGPSGIGKSSILRAIGGLWASGRGSIERCASSQSFFVPQEPYLCLGTLRDNCTYPGNRNQDPGADAVVAAAAEVGGSSPKEPSDQEIKAALDSVNIGYLSERFELDRKVDLDTVLSGGERQRLGFARLLLRPTNLRFAIMDEATSALDEANENIVYQLLNKKVMAYVSVGHRANLVKYHTHKLQLDRTSSGGCSWHFATREEFGELSKAQLASRGGLTNLESSLGEVNDRDPVLADLDVRQGGFSDSWSPI